jgi:chorismate dehydratase
MRIGAVNYLNSKPLVCGMEELGAGVRVTYDLPSRLADSLAAGRLDVALVPSVELFRTPGYRVVSDACVACRGPVLSVKLHFRVPPLEVRRVALDEGSRTSAGLTQILLAELCGVRPAFERLPIGCGVDETDGDAVLLIGDRAMQEERGARSEERGPASERRNRFVEVWDLGERWCEWTGLSFVFAMWIAREGVAVSEIEGVLEMARDEGERRLEEIAKREAAGLGITTELALGYLSQSLHFRWGEEESAGLRRFYDLCVEHGLAPAGSEGVLDLPRRRQRKGDKIRPCGRH